MKPSSSPHPVPSNTSFKTRKVPFQGKIKTRSIATMVHPYQIPGLLHLKCIEANPDSHMNCQTAETKDPDLPPSMRQTVFEYLSQMPLRTSPREIKTEVKIEEEEQEEEIEGEEVNEDEDLPPPILEREESCGENEDTDGDNKEEEDESVTGPSTKKNGKPREKELEEVEEEDEEKQKNLMEALAHVFSADGDSLGKKRALVSPVSAPKPVVLHRGRGRPPLSASNASPSASSFKFAPLRVPVSGGPSTSTDGRRNYGPPPPMPRVLRNQATPSNTSLLENRKRTTMAVDKNGIVVKRASLEAYNGGRAGEKFRSLQPTSTSPGTSTSSVEQMLREQSPVRIQVTAGGQDNTMQEALELAAQQRETIGQVAKASTNHSFLLGSLIMNGLNTLRDRNQDDYQNFSADLFALITKYRLQ